MEITNEFINDKQNLIRILNDLILQIDLVNYYDFYKYYRIFLDGDWIGFTDDIHSLHNKLIKLRRDKLINKEFSISINNSNELIILTDYGRLIRPLLTVDNFKIKIQLFRNFKNFSYVE